MSKHARLYRLSFVPWLAATALVAGCGSYEDSPSGPVGAVKSATAQSLALEARMVGEHTPPESASRPAVTATPKVDGLLKMKRGERLTLHIESPEEELRGHDIHVFVSSLGFDGWSVRRPLTTWTVDAESTDIDVDPFALPLRPVGSASEVRFEVEYTVETGEPESPTQLVRIPSQPITVSFSPDERQVYIGHQTDVVEVQLASELAIEGSEVDLAQVRQLVDAALAGEGPERRRVLHYVERGLAHLTGHVTDDAGNSYGIESAPREGIIGSPESRGESGPGVPMITLPGAWITPRTIDPAPEPAPGAETKLVFFSFATSSFRDSDFGEKALPGPNSTTSFFPNRGRAPMSYVSVRGFEMSNVGEIKFDHGYDYHLNSAGFLVEEVRPRKLALAFPHRNIGDGTHTVEIFGFESNRAAIGDQGLVDVHTLDLGAGNPVHVMMVRETPASRSAAVVGAMLTTPSLTLPPKTQIVAGLGCPGDTRLQALDEATGQTVDAEACVASGVIYLGRNIRQDAQGRRFIAPGDTSEEKYVVGHELGHSIEHNTLGGAAGLVNQGRPLWDGELCGCGHVRGANSIHCLQSAENQAGGYLEGFAHFVATAIMNPQVTKNVPFVYYKEFLKPSAFAFSPPRTVLPPVKIQAGSPVAWLRNRCDSGVQADRSTEYDWMTFLWGIHERQTPAAIDYATWMGIVKDGFCGGGSCPNLQAPLSWAPLRANALVKFGGNPFDQRLARMDRLGFDSAVDH